MNIIRIVAIFTLLVVGVAAYWYIDAAKYSEGNDLRYTRRGLPAKCRIESVLGEPKARATAYFAKDNFRIDIAIEVEGWTRYGSEILKSDGAYYVWNDEYAEITMHDSFYVIMTNIARPHAWACRPWFFVDTSRFVPPGDVDFVDNRAR